jgi:hypothetical protein
MPDLIRKLLQPLGVNAISFFLQLILKRVAASLFMSVFIILVMPVAFRHPHRNGFFGHLFRGASGNEKRHERGDKASFRLV